MSVMEEESQWSHLPGDILKTIGNKLNNNSDSDGDGDGYTHPVAEIHNLRLRSVCKSWRSSVSPPLTIPANNPVVPFPIAPNPSLNPNRSGHFNLSHTAIYLLQQPPQQLSSTSITATTTTTRAYSYWLLRVENNNNGSSTSSSTSTQSKWRPLNPLSRVLTSNNGLPKGFPRSINLLNFRIYHVATSYALRFVDCTEAHIPVKFQELKSFHPRKVVMSTSGPLVAMAISGFKLYCIKVGDEKWRAVDDSNYDDVAFRKGKFYAVDIRGRVVSVGGSDLKASEIVPRLQFYGHGGNFKNLVESNGELFLIDKYCEPEEQVWYDQEVGAYMADFDPDETVHLKIYKLNEEKGEWEMVNDLDDHVFFVGDDCSYSFSARDFPALKPNCVYFCDDSFIDYNEDEKKLGEFCADTGVYCLDDGTCGPLANFPDHWPLFWPPPTWLKPKALKSKK